MLHVPSVLSTGSGLSESQGQTPANQSSPNKQNHTTNTNNNTPSSLTNSSNKSPNETNNNEDNTKNPLFPPHPPKFNTYNSDDDEDDGIAAKRRRHHQQQQEQQQRNQENAKSLYSASAGSMESFDMLDQIPQSLHALCVGMNRDCSRIYAGHDSGFTIWNIITPLPPTETESINCGDGNDNNNNNNNHMKPKTPHRTVTLARMFGKTFVELGGKGFVFCAAVLNRTDYAVCGTKTKIKDVESEELFVLQGSDVRHKLMGRIAADGGRSLRHVHIEQDRIFALCATSFHLFDLSGARPLLALKSCAPVPSVGNAGFFATSTAAIQNAVSKTVGKAMGIVGTLWSSWGGSSGTNQDQKDKTNSPADASTPLDSARGAPPPPPPLLSGPSSNATAVFTAPNSDRPSHVQEFTSVLSVLSGADEDTMSVCAIPGTQNAGGFSVIDWRKLQVIKSNIAAHQGHLASIKITMGSGSVKLLAVTASTTGTTCRVWNALTGEKLRNLRMTHMGPGGAAPSTFKLRGVEMDCFGRVVVLCQDSSSTTTTTKKDSSPQTSAARLVNNNNNNNNNSNATTRENASSADDQQPITHNNALEALFFDTDSPDDGLAPVAGEHYNLENSSFAARAVTVGVGMVAGQRVAEAKDAMRPLCRIVVPLRPTNNNNNNSSTANKNNNNNNNNQNAMTMLQTKNVFSDESFDKNNKDNKASPTTVTTTNAQQQQQPEQQYNNIEELISIITLSGDAKKMKYVVTPDSMPIVISRIHSSGVKSIAQVTFGGLPREHNHTIKNVNTSQENNNSSSKNANDVNLTGTTTRMGADIRDAKMKTGTARLDVIKLF